MKNGAFLLVTAFILALTHTGFEGKVQAQDQGEDESAESSGEESEQSGVSPGFFFQNLSTEVSAAPGQQAEFQFVLQNTGGQREIEVEAVHLRQERNGSITYDEEAEPPDEVSFQTPQEFTVEAKQEFTIEGSISVNQGGGAGRYYGIFVYDRGRPVEVSPQNQSPEEQERRIVVNYVTRYLLRVELAVAGAEVQNFDGLEITEQGLQSRDGKAYAYAVLQNNTESVLEVRAQVYLRRQGGRPLGPPFFLHLPVSATDSPPEKYESSILPGAEVLVHRQVPEPVLPGAYEMELGIQSGPITVRSSTATVEVEEGQFPAQNQVVSRIVGNVRVSPSRILFSRRPRGDRIQSIKVVNESDQEINVTLDAEPMNGDADELSWLTYRPKQFSVPKNQSRGVTMSAAGDTDGHAYGFLAVTVEPTETLAGGTRKVPVAFLSNDPLNVSLETENLQQGMSDAGPVLTLPVQNTGNVHLNLQATMTIETEFGDDVTLKGGFGDWILPGETGEVEFQLEEVPPKGSYPVRITLKPGHGKEPITLERTLNVQQ